MSALNENLGQSVECRNLECVAVKFIGMVRTKVGGISVAYTQNATVSFKCAGQHGAGIRNYTSLVVLNLNGHDGYIASIGGDEPSV